MRRLISSKRSWLIILVILAIVAYFAIRVSRNPLDPRLSKADNEFGFKLLREMVRANPDRNLVICPVGLALTLQLAYNGATGQTKRDMADALGLEGLSTAEIDEANRKLIAMLRNPELGVNVRIVNSIWGGMATQFRTEFLQTNERYYGAKIGDSGDSKPCGHLYLISDSQLAGQWMYAFERTMIDDLPFKYRDGHSSRVTTLLGYGVFESTMGEYRDASIPEIIRVPYKGERVSMYIMLTSCAEWPRVIDSHEWERWMSELRPMVTLVLLPVFSLSSDFDLPLDSMGMSPESDFSKMYLRPTPAKGIKHIARIEVHQEGSRPMPVKHSPLPKHFLANRPFYFFIRDDRTGLILFMGWVADPTEGMESSDQLH